MSASLSHGESEIAARLRDAGLSLPAATLAVVLATREHARPESEMVDIVRQYQNLEDRSVARDAISALRSRGWLEESTSYGQTLVHQAPDLRDKIASALHDPTVGGALSALRSTLEPDVRILGPMKDERVYTTYLDVLRTAQREICLPMLATTPELTSVPIIQERAKRGVRVRIILGSEKLVARLRGDTMIAVARDSVSGWQRHAAASRNIELRLSDSAQDMRIATCMLIDNRVLRLDVYDPARQRSLEGVMIEFNSSQEMELNVVSVFRSVFEQAWSNASPAVGWKRIPWFFRRHWQWTLFALFVVLTFASHGSSWEGIFASVAATFMFSGLVSSWGGIQAALRRFRGD